ncbi:hypothetical protein ACMXYX_17880 (plasmid) [Neptuniibacter sp. QD72_48]|uniref:hypothetical protein n=1 Tax=Neptuniibacter sp. QD72_48 TaxID=3398214 RepID=UPI0039F5F4F1
MNAKVDLQKVFDLNTKLAVEANLKQMSNFWVGLRNLSKHTKSLVDDDLIDSVELLKLTIEHGESEGIPKSYLTLLRKAYKQLDKAVAAESYWQKKIDDESRKLARRVNKHQRAVRDSQEVFNAFDGIEHACPEVH